MNISSSGKVTPWNVTVDIEGATMSMQLDHVQGTLDIEKPSDITSKVTV